MAWWWWTALAWAAPQPVVALGDGLVGGVPLVPGSPAVESSTGPALPTGWVAALGDCLEEHAPGRYSVIDRSVPGETAATATVRADGIRELQPSRLVVAVGAQEFSATDADQAAFRDSLDGLLAALMKDPAPPILLVGMIPPTAAQLADRTVDQADVDARTAAWNGELVAAAAPLATVTVLDLVADWPLDGDDRERLTLDGWRLSDQGHARVGAMVCDAVLMPPAPVSEGEQ